MKPFFLSTRRGVYIFSLILFLLLHSGASGQHVLVLTTGKSVSLRGLSVVNDSTIWVSGSSGTVAFSGDGGQHWKWMQVHRYEKTDFRDIEAFSDREAVIMGITEPAVILRTIDGGRNWKVVFEDSSKKTFLDAMAFSADTGIVIGDPIQQKMFLAVSGDRGAQWILSNASDVRGRKSENAHLDSGEAFFAASGSNFQPLPANGWVGVTGGKKSSILLPAGKSYPLIMNQGSETTGANSIAVNPQNANEAFVVGGDFAHDTSRYKNALRIQFVPFLQIPSAIPPHGYRSCVEYLDSSRLVSCGTSGVDFSSDGGFNWQLISTTGFHVCRRSQSGKVVFLAGAHGTIARLDCPDPDISR